LCPTGSRIGGRPTARRRTAWSALLTFVLLLAVLIAWAAVAARPSLAVG